MASGRRHGPGHVHRRPLIRSPSAARSRRRAGRASPSAWRPPGPARTTRSGETIEASIKDGSSVTTSKPRDVTVTAIDSSQITADAGGVADRARLASPATGGAAARLDRRGERQQHHQELRQRLHRRCDGQCRGRRLADREIPEGPELDRRLPHRRGRLRRGVVRLRDRRAPGCPWPLAGAGPAPRTPSTTRSRPTSATAGQHHDRPCQWRRRVPDGQRRREHPGRRRRLRHRHRGGRRGAARPSRPPSAPASRPTRSARTAASRSRPTSTTRRSPPRAT